MRILLFGGTTATHALAWKLFDSPAVDQLLTAPGNGGTNSLFAFRADIDPANESAAVNFIFTDHIDLVVADTEAVLSGVCDAGTGLRQTMLGAGRGVVPLLSSRCAMHSWLQQHNLPALRGRVFARLEDAVRYAAGQPLPLQMSADDPGGRSLICTDRAAMYGAIQQCLPGGPSANDRGILIEEVLPGPLVAMSWLRDGQHTMPLPPVRLYPLHDQRYNPAAGAHSASTPLWQRLDRHLRTTLLPLVDAALRQDELSVKGWVTAECILAQRGPLITRLCFTPPDQVVAALLPRLGSDLAPLLLATAEGRLAQASPPEWKTASSVAVLLHAAVWPASSSGYLLTGLDRLDSSALVFHHHTRSPQELRYNPVARKSLLPPLFGPWTKDQISTTISTGSQILTVASSATALLSARTWAYHALSQIEVAGSTYRRDVGAQELS